MPVGEVKAAIFGHAEFTTFNASVTALFAKWRNANIPRLKAIKSGDHPKALIETLAEDLLDTFQKARCSTPTTFTSTSWTYWAETMQDDVYLLAQEGWAARAKSTS